MFDKAFKAKVYSRVFAKDFQTIILIFVCFFAPENKPLGNDSVGAFSGGRNSNVPLSSTNERREF